MVNEGDFIRDPGFGSKVLEVGDEFLKSVVKGPIFFLEGSLNEFGEVGMCSGFDIKGVEGSFKVFSKFIEGLFFGINGSVQYFVVPHF